MIEYTQHALLRMDVRHIKESQVESTLRSPDEVIEQGDERDKYRFEKKIDNIKIVAIAYWYKEENRFKVKTVWKK